MRCIIIVNVILTKGYEMQIEINKVLTYSYIPVYKVSKYAITPYRKNDKTVDFGVAYNVNPKLDWKGKAIEKIKGTWSQEKVDGFYGNY